VDAWTLARLTANLSGEIARASPWLLAAGITFWLIGRALSVRLEMLGRQAALTCFLLFLASLPDLGGKVVMLGYYERRRSALPGWVWLVAIPFTLSILHGLVQGVPELKGLARFVLKGLLEGPWPSSLLASALILAPPASALGLKLAVICWGSYRLACIALRSGSSLGAVKRVFVKVGDEVLQRRVVSVKPYAAREAQNPNVLVVGGSGAGKSNAVKLMLSMTSFPNTLVFDFTDEYGFLEAYGFKKVDLSEECFNVFKCKVADIVDAANIAFPGMGDVQRSLLYEHASEAEDLHELIGMLESKAHDRRVEANVRGAALALAQRLKVVASEVKPGGLDPAELLSGRNLVRFKGLTSEEAKAFLAELLLRELFSVAERKGGKLNLLLVIDEAHRVLVRASTTLYSVESVVNRIMREVRKWGVAVLLASQRFSDVPDACVANAASIYVMSNPSPEDLDRIASFGPWLREVAQQLERGEAFDLRRAEHAVKVETFKFHLFKEAKRAGRTKPVKAEGAVKEGAKAEGASKVEEAKEVLRAERVKVEEATRAEGAIVKEETARAEEVGGTRPSVDEVYAFLSSMPKPLIEKLERREVPVDFLEELKEGGVLEPVEDGYALTREAEEALRRLREGLKGLSPALSGEAARVAEFLLKRRRIALRLLRLGPSRLSRRELEELVKAGVVKFEEGAPRLTWAAERALKALREEL